MQSAQTPAGNRKPGSIALIVALALVLLGIAAVAVTWLFGGLFPPQPTLRDLLSGSSNLTSPVEDTRVLCAETDCVEGWRTEVGVFMRFRTSDMAEYWQYVIGPESIRNENIVLDMTGLDLTRDQKRLAIDTLFSRRDWRVN